MISFLQRLTKVQKRCETHIIWLLQRIRLPGYLAIQPAGALCIFLPTFDFWYLMRPARTSAMGQTSRHTANCWQLLSASQKRTLFGIRVGYLSFSRSGDLNMPAQACFAPRRLPLVLAVEEDSSLGEQRNSGRFIWHLTELRTVAQQDNILGPSRHTLKPRVWVLCRILEAWALLSERKRLTNCNFIHCG